MTPWRRERHSRQLRRRTYRLPAPAGAVRGAEESRCCRGRIAQRAKITRYHSGIAGKDLCRPEGVGRWTGTVRCPRCPDRFAPGSKQTPEEAPPCRPVRPGNMANRVGTLRPFLSSSASALP